MSIEVNQQARTKIRDCVFTLDTSIKLGRADVTLTKVSSATCSHPLDGMVAAPTRCLESRT